MVNLLTNKQFENNIKSLRQICQQYGVDDRNQWWQQWKWIRKILAMQGQPLKRDRTQWMRTRNSMPWSFIVRDANKRFRCANDFFWCCRKETSTSIYVPFVRQPSERRWIGRQNRSLWLCDIGTFWAPIVLCPISLRFRKESYAKLNAKTRNILVNKNYFRCHCYSFCVVGRRQLDFPTVE